MGSRLPIARIEEIAGYRACENCDGFVDEAFARVSSGLCVDCLSRGIADVRANLAVIVEGKQVKPSPSKRNRKKNAKRYEKRRHLAEYKERHHLRKMARLAAARRLAALHPLEFVILTAIEREARGLDPWPDHLVAEAIKAGVHLPPGQPPIATLRALTAYHAHSDGSAQLDAPLQAGE